MRVSIIALTALTVSACVPAEPTKPPGQPYALSSKAVRAIQADVRQAMKDPDSARFGRIAAAIDSDGVVTACGWVNGKNSYGGYTGELPFMGIYSLERGRYMLADIASASEASATVIVCRNRGVAM